MRPPTAMPCGRGSSTRPYFASTRATLARAFFSVAECDSSPRTSSSARRSAGLPTKRPASRRWPSASGDVSRLRSAVAIILVRWWCSASPLIASSPAAASRKACSTSTTGSPSMRVVFPGTGPRRNVMPLRAATLVLWTSRIVCVDGFGPIPCSHRAESPVTNWPAPSATSTTASTSISPASTRSCTRVAACAGREYARTAMASRRWGVSSAGSAMTPLPFRAHPCTATRSAIAVSETSRHRSCHRVIRWCCRVATAPTFSHLRSIAAACRRCSSFG